MSVWHIGDVRLTAVLESADAFSPELLRAVVLPEAAPQALAELPWLAPHWVDDEGGLRFVTQAFLVESRGRRIVVDTCLGDDKPRRDPAFDRLSTGFLERLAEAGARPEDVDVVLCTHLHFDHVGWNTRRAGDRWVPTFPNARYLFARDEWGHWRSEPRHEYVMADSLRPVWEAGLVDLVEPDHAITDEVSLTPTPGHTPGHVSVRLRSAAAEAVITGDVLHHPCQVARPRWRVPADSDRGLAEATRARLLDDAAARGVLLVGSHFAAPAVGRVSGAAGERRFVPVGGVGKGSR